MAAKTLIARLGEVCEPAQYLVFQTCCSKFHPLAHCRLTQQ
jgi:hypothetical protein